MPSEEPPQTTSQGGAIVVDGQRPRGSVIGSAKPELELGFFDIRSYGVSSVAELIAELAPQTDGTGAPPVVLLNGRRIPSIAEIQDIPVEAISRVEVLPEEVAVLYGYQANQKVINVVLRERYRTVSTEVRGSVLADGDGRGGQVSAGVFRVRDDTRVNLNAKYHASDEPFQGGSDRPAMTGGNRAGQATSGGSGSSGGVPNASREWLTLSGSASRPILPDVSGSISASFERKESAGYQRSSEEPPPGEDDMHSPGARPATARESAQRSTVETKHLAIALSGAIRPWQWSFNGSYTDDTTRTSAQSTPATNPDDQSLLDQTSRVSTSTLTGDLLLSGSLLRLPAGYLTSSVRMGASILDVETDVTVHGVPASADRSRNTASAQISLDMPLSSRDRGVLGAVGNVAMNGSATVEHLSDGGTLATFSYGLRWEPVSRIGLRFSRTEQESAPTIQQISDPEIVISNVPVFDFAVGETVFVSLISGGNPGLLPSRRSANRLSLVLQPLARNDITLLASYADVRTDNPAYGFTAPSPRIEEAFPDRFTRDQDGALTGIDGRPINVAQSRSSRLRWGVQLSAPIRTSQQRQVMSWVQAGARPEERPADLEGVVIRQRSESDSPMEPPGGVMRAPVGDPHGDQGPRMTFAGGPGSPLGGGPPGLGRIQFALFHTVRLAEELDLGPSLPVLDLLGGDAIGSTGGRPRHELEAQFGYFNDGIGIRLTGKWQSATHVDNVLGDGAVLRFGDRATLDLRAFANLGQIPGLGRRHPFLSGTRLSAGIDNLLDARTSVRDQAGAIPVNYDPGLLEGSGRTISLSLRKIF